LPAVSATAKGQRQGYLSERSHVLSNIRTDPRWLPFLRDLGVFPEQLAAIKFDVKVPK
jgi:hypothetical protein